MEHGPPNVCREAIPHGEEIHNHLDSALEKIAERDFATLEDVLRTIALLKDAGHMIVIVRRKYGPRLVSADLGDKKMYLISNLLRPDTNPIRWWGKQLQILDCNAQPFFSDPNQIDIALAILVMGAGLNAAGLMLEMPLFDLQPNDRDVVHIVDQDGDSHGAFGAFDGRKIVVSSPRDIQVLAFDALLASRHHSKSWNLSFLGLRFATVDPDGLPDHISAFVRSVFDKTAKSNQPRKINFQPS